MDEETLSVEITGCWLRTRGKMVQLLLEIGGEWKLISEELSENEFSILTETKAILKAQVDPYTN